MILAAQKQALRTNAIKLNTDKTSDTQLCRLCGHSTETIRYITSGCSKLAQKEYRNAMTQLDAGNIGKYAENMD